MRRNKTINKHFYNSLKCFITTDVHHRYNASERLLYVHKQQTCVLSYELYQRLLKIKNEK